MDKERFLALIKHDGSELPQELELFFTHPGPYELEATLSALGHHYITCSCGASIGIGPDMVLLSYSGLDQHNK